MGLNLLIITLILLCSGFYTQNTIDGSTLLNLNKADSSKYYEYKLDTRSSTVLKIVKGNVAYCKFICNTTQPVETRTFQTGREISFVNENKEPIHNSVKIYNRDKLSLIICLIDPASRQLKGNRYYYYKNGNISTIIIEDSLKKVFIEKIYTKKGVKFSENTRKIENDSSELKLFNFRGQLKNRVTNSNQLTIYERFKGGTINRIDSLSKKALDGSRTIFFKSGNKKTFIPYRYGKINGVYVHYYRSGITRKRVEYSNSHPTGQFILYRIDGSIKKYKGEIR